MSYTLFSITERTARKPHACIWCGQEIGAGEKYKDERSIYDGNIQHNHWHHECWESSRKAARAAGEFEFTPFENERGRTE